MAGAIAAQQAYVQDPPGAGRDCSRACPRWTSLSSRGAASIPKCGGIIISAGRGRGIRRGRGRAVKCGAVAAYSEVLRASLNDAAASNSEVPRLRLSDSDPETQQLIRETQQSGLARLYQGKQPLRHPAGGVGVRLPEPHALVVIAAPKLRRSCADENGCGRCFCDTCYQL